MSADATNKSGPSDEAANAAPDARYPDHQHHPPEPADDTVSTQHTLATADTELCYTATAGRIVLKQEVLTDGTFDGHQAKVEMFVVSYVADDAEPATRPVTFAFNGGPPQLLGLAALRPTRAAAGDGR